MHFSSHLTALTASLLMAVVTMAQQEAPPAPPTPPNVGQQELAPKVDPSTLIKDDIQEPQMSGQIIAKYYREYTGKRVIVSKAALGVEINFTQEGPLTYKDAADLLVKTAFLEGLVFVPSGPNEVKLLPAPSVRNKGGIPLVTDALALPDNEQLVSYVMHFDNIKAEDAMSIFNGFVASLDPHGVIVQIPNANALLITENSQLIRSLVDLKDRIDVPQERYKQTWVTIENADAEETATSVKEIMDFTAEQNAQLTAGIARQAGIPLQAQSGNSANANKGTNTAQKGGKSSLLIKADTRTNRIFLMGRPIDTEVAEGLIRGFDAPLDKRNYFKHKLKYIAVGDFIPVAEKAIDLTSSKPSEGGSGGGSGSARRNTGGTNRSTGGSTGSNSNGNSSLADSSRAEAPEAIILGKTMLVADNLNNTLIVKGPPQSISVVKDLIREMDIAAEQVQISAVFGRYDVTEGMDFRTDFARTYQATRGATSGFAGQSRNGAGIFDARDLTQVNGNSSDTTNSVFNLSNIAAATSGLSLYGNIGNHFNATLSLMETEGRFKLTSRPTVFTTNNRRASLSSGQQIAVPTNSFQSGTVGGQSTNISFRDVLLELEVIPLVNSADEVTLQISFTNQSPSGSTEIDGNDIPTIAEETLTTTVTVPNGQTIVIGGLISETSNVTEGGVPVLRKIPVIKGLFSSKSETLEREELVIFIQPTIVNGQKELLGLQQKNSENSALVRDVRAGTSVLPPKFTEHNKSYFGKNDPKPAKKKKRRFFGIRR